MRIFINHHSVRYLDDTVNFNTSFMHKSQSIISTTLAVYHPESVLRTLTEIGSVVSDEISLETKAEDTWYMTHKDKWPTECLLSLIKSTSCVKWTKKW